MKCPKQSRDYYEQGGFGNVHARAHSASKAIVEVIALEVILMNCQFCRIEIISIETFRLEDLCI